MNENFILTLIDKFSAAAIAEFDLDEGGLHIRLRKEGPRAAGASAAAAAAAEGLPPAEGVHLGLPVGPARGGEAITSPIVATFYASPGPDSPAFVGAGSLVKAGDTLCILEAMKMMNHLEAEFDCEILSIKASNGDLVEYGQTLFEVKRL
ncbi:MAG: acetyl-CoA carboxylase biotin carboxyl carrier protein [Spirochaetaceae bacterium]|jgi:acetyl-CoA carboxylase biotin carboxyl carrier protein|nr:acetyl-CoA carboxylase biotin carboxyl carrier protein [Spirochaetaceae bacterium]